LKLFIAHAGASLPSLIGRLDSCVFHDEAVANRLRKAPSEYLKDMYFDAISYGAPQLQTLITLVGEDRIVFGTDNPFFPPPGKNIHEDVSTQLWPSTVKVHETIDSFPSSSLVAKIKYQNAKHIFQL